MGRDSGSAPLFEDSLNHKSRRCAVSNDKEFTHYIVVNEVNLGDARIVKKLNDWVSLAFVRLGIGGPNPITDYGFLENHALVPKIPN